MAIQMANGEDTAKVASSTPATLIATSASEGGQNNTEIQHETSTVAAVDKIVSNAVSIDVIAPATGAVRNNPQNESYCAAVGYEKRVSFETGKGKSGNIISRWFKNKTEGLTRTQVAILCIFPFVEFFAATVISIQGPFYPDTARKKGATPSEYGLVFGSFEIVVFIMAPIYGMKMSKLNPHRLFNYGIFTTSLTCLMFGFVHHIPDRVPFILVSLTIRVVEAIGDAAFVIASFSIIAVEFPESVATTFAMMETFYGLGMIAGPTVGGALYEAGGFTLPFAVMGALLFITALATYKYITRVTNVDVEKAVGVYGFNMFKMLKIPVILLTAYGTFAAATGIGFLSNNLEHHLEEFGLDKFKVGCIFMLNGGVYALSAPVWGRLCDQTKQLKIFSLVGAILTIAGFALVGPIPFIPSWDPSIPVICLGLIIFGLGLGSTLVSAFVQFLTDALANGYPDDVSTYGLVSGLWTSMTALGFFCGPVVGGFLDHQVGFRWGTLFIYMEQFLLIVFLIRFFLQFPDPEDNLKPAAAKDKMDDVVITYAVKMNTPKPISARKRGDGASSTDLKSNVVAVTNTNEDSFAESVTNTTEEPINSSAKNANNAANDSAATIEAVTSSSTSPSAPPAETRDANNETDSAAVIVSTSIAAEHATTKENESLASTASSGKKVLEGQENPSFVADHQ